MNEEQQTSSEFGQGLTYCLGMFLAHSGREIIPEKAPENLKETEPWLWFNGASDHCYDLIIPENFPPALKTQLDQFKSKCLEWGHGFLKPTKEDKIWALQEAKNLLRAIDEHFGIPTIKGEWE